MTKSKARVNSSRRNFLTGSASVAGLAATAAVLYQLHSQVQITKMASKGLT